MNVRVNLNYTIYDGAEIVFKAPCDASRVTGLIVYYPNGTEVVSSVFAFADAHTNDLGNIDNLFVAGAVVKVILDTETNMAFVQNAATNAYLEGRFAGIGGGSTGDTCVQVSCTQPADENTKVWVNPCGVAENADSHTASDVSGIVGLALNEMLNSTAARYATIEDALAGNSATAGGKILAYTCGGALNIMLLDDIESATKISVTKDCTIHLNGKKISFTAAGAYLDINTASNVTINGKVAGSEITKVCNSQVAEKCIVGNGTALHLIGGTYSIYGGHLSVNCIRSEKSDLLKMEKCTVIVDIYANGEVSDGTSTYSGIAYGINAKNATVIDNCHIEISTRLDDGDTQTFEKNQIYGIYLDKASLTITNSKLFAKSTLKHALVYGIITATDTTNSCTVEDCYITADGAGDYNEDGQLVTVGVYAIKHPNITINGGYYWGARDGLDLDGYARLNGGVYAGPQHGGAYISGKDVKIKNATFLCVKYDGEVGKFLDSHYGAVYCTDNNPDGQIWFDNCCFKSDISVGYGIVAKVNNDYPVGSAGANVYLSNVTFNGKFGTQLRSDSKCAIYLGKNVKYSTSTIGGTLDTTTYADQEFSFETEPTTSNGLLSVKDERGNWVNLSGVYMKR